jgi:TonB family protein
MNELNLGLTTTGTIPQHRRVTAGVYTLATLFHVALFVLLIWAGRSRAVRVTPGEMMPGGIAAWIPGSIGGAPAAPKPAPVAAPKKAAETIDRSAGGAQSAGAGGATGVGSGSGPVRIGSGGDVTLLKRVEPIYPRQLQSMRIAGTVVLDAVIRRDGTIGDVTVLQSSNAAFAQSAITAVKQWRYNPLSFEGILTVTVNFTLT